VLFSDLKHWTIKYWNFNLKKNIDKIKRSSAGLEALLEAKRQRQLSEISSTGGMAASASIRAEQAKKKAVEMLSLDNPLELTTGNEALPPEVADPKEDDFYGIRETLKSGADFINLDASSARLELLSDLNCLDMGIDAAQSINARNSLEKMLIHQAAACHSMSMSLLFQAQERSYKRYNRLDADKKNTDLQIKLIATSARLMDTYYRALQTFQKLRTGGQQIVTVQHVNVSGESQAIVAGKMNTLKEGADYGGKSRKRKSTSRKVGSQKRKQTP
jgi:hypothetical protein